MSAKEIISHKGKKIDWTIQLKYLQGFHDNDN